MNPLLKGALVGALVAITGPIGLVALGVYYLRKSQEEQQKQTQLLAESLGNKEEVIQ